MIADPRTWLLRMLKRAKDERLPTTQIEDLLLDIDQSKICPNGFGLNAGFRTDGEHRVDDGA